MPIPFDSPILIRNEFNCGFLTFEKIGMGDQGKARGIFPLIKEPILRRKPFNQMIATKFQ